MTVVDFETARRKRMAQAVRDEARAIRTRHPSLIERILEGDATRRVSQAMAAALTASTLGGNAQIAGETGLPDQNRPFSRREGGTE